MSETELEANINPDATGDTDLGVRQRTQTQKGLEYQISLNEQKFKSSASAWRRQNTCALRILSDSPDVDLIRGHRDSVQRCFDDLCLVFDNLQGMQETCKAEAAKFEEIELQHQDLMQNIASRIQDLENTKDENASLSSHVSRSASSQRSRKSNISRISDAATRHAALKTKLKFIDIESKFKAELKKLQTIKKIEMAGAEMTALKESFSGDRSDTKSQLSIPEIDKKDLVSKYIQNQGHFNLETNITESDANFFPTTARTDTDVTNHVSVSGTSDIVINTAVSTFSTVSSQTYPITTSESLLNPTAAIFCPQEPTQTTWMYKDSFPTALQNLQPVCKTSNENFVSDDKCSHANVSQNNSAEQGLLELAKSLAEQVNLSRLPPPEPNVFSGDPIQYPAWKAAFNTLIDKRNIPPGERIYYLKKYLSGSVRQVVENYFLLSTDNAYDSARSLLDERYGEPFIVANAFRSKLDSWPKINVKDAQGLLKYSDFLKQCLSAQQTISSLSILSDSQENRKMLTKLPDWLVSRWNRYVAQRKEQKGEFPPFKDFVEFIGKEAKIACDPITSPQSLKCTSFADSEKGYKAQQFQDSKRSHGGRTLLSDTVETPVSAASETKVKGSCILCSGKHDLDTCKSFLSKSLPDRKAFLRQKDLCFGCFQTGHISKRCRQRKKCTVCFRFHPTSLHGDVKPRQGQVGSSDTQRNGSNGTNMTNVPPSVDQSTQSGVAFLGGTGEGSKCSMIVPVYISHCDSPGTEVLIYALLDTQSDTTFVLQDTCTALGLSGVDVKLSLSTMYAENRVVDSQKVKGLMVRGFNNTLRISLPDAYTRNIMPANRSHIPTPKMASKWPHLENIADQLLDLNPCQIGLLIGYNCPQCLIPREVIVPVGDGPFGQRTDLGWGIVGVVDPCNSVDDPIGVSHRVITREVSNPVQDSHNYVQFSLRTKVKELISSDILKLMEQDLVDPMLNSAYSQEDKRFLSILEEGIKFKDGHYELPLPFRDGSPSVSNNKSIALRRLKSLTRRFEKDAKFRSDYFSFMQNLVDNGHAERVIESVDSSVKNAVWYIPHHGVYHPRKPEKIRVVFDCSATFEGTSLNSHLLQGPDLTNKLVGVMCRFRQEPIALLCDIEQMFYQFRVSPEHRSYLRFLWWDSEDYTREPVEYHMTVHLFGATSSPGCANFALKRIAKDNESEFGSKAADFLRRDFYVDDGLKSLLNIPETRNLIDNSTAMCRKGGVRLCKFVSNAREVIDHVAPDDRAKDLENIDLVSDKLPMERALGIVWCIESDSFKFRIALRDRPLTRRGILSSVSCLYDPLGFIAPVVLAGKQILQQMCADGAEWDDPLPESLRKRWESWCASLKYLDSLQIPRCIKPDGFGESVKTELHHFSDASSFGYGQCSYIRMWNSENQIACAFVMGKARVVPVKPVTVPRLELSAAVLSVRTASMLQQELDYQSISHVYWTDSKVVLGYISNEAKRFHVYVANRVQQIKEHTGTDQWYYVNSRENPADIASRGLHANELVSSSTWFRGPEFLWQQNAPYREPQTFQVSPDDPELKQKTVQSFSCDVENSNIFSSMLERLTYFSSWYRAKKAVALCLRYKAKLHQIVSKRFRKEETKCLPMSGFDPLTVSELDEAEIEIIRHVQAHSFKSEISTLKDNEVLGVSSDRRTQSSRKMNLKGKSDLHRLDPFLDSKGLLRIGGRIQHAKMPDKIKYPVVLPKRCHITSLIAHHFHDKMFHQGRGITVNEIRNNGFWIIGCSAVVSGLISKCLVCRRLRGVLQDQKMSSLPSDRLEPAPPFTFCAVDFFGPFYIKEGRKELKRYGVLFTCLLCRAVHVETSNSLDTDSFINCLRRFIAIRGPIRQLRSDRGTNFVGAENELKNALNELDNDRIRRYLLQENCDCETFEFKMNVPAASHMGGVWERQIRSVRNVMSSLLLKHGQQLDDESLRTFLHESAAIVNSRPLSVDNLNDPMSVSPLTPNQLLTMKTKVILPPPGNFQSSSLYSRKRWRRTQYLVNEFWIRWRSEFLQNLQARNKWQSPKRNLTVGDIVIMKDDNQPRNRWQLARVYEAYLDSDGLVRKVKIAMADGDLDSRGKRSGSLTYLERPIHKLILLQETG